MAGRREYDDGYTRRRNESCGGGRGRDDRERDYHGNYERREDRRFEEVGREDRPRNEEERGRQPAGMEISFERRFEPGGSSGRPPLICYGCKVVGHYHNDCWRFWTNEETRRRMEADGYQCPPEFARRGRSVSPRQQKLVHLKRSPSEEPRTSSRLDDLGKTVATMKDFVDLEMARREVKEQKKREKELAKQREEEEQATVEQARRIKEQREMKKLEKQKRCEADREAITKAVDIQLALRLKNVLEVLKTEVHRVVREIIPELKGKAKVEKTIPSTFNPVEEASEVEEITEGTGGLYISEKRKREEDTPVGDSSSVTTPAKRTMKRATARPLRLTKRLRTRNTHTKVTQSRITRRAQTEIKATLKNSNIDRLQFLDSVRRELINCHHDEIKAICGREEVAYKTKLADLRADVKFGTLDPDAAVVNLTADFDDQTDEEGTN
ncbi:hypothetical protein CBR_g30799 [Chara braunii]|uniref:CCHC-type domain-containing protein n=1 Tax=Chara braunii TaxID=69332 RepID=A0A388JXI1_CHABU|nr:hypothetical protein CBR_g30799 [Chara braunii]|eukprot:GBG62478.1 hypothetical protein CBR_g30799 [Chara braunii]